MKLIINKREIQELALWGYHYKDKCEEVRIPFEADENKLLAKIDKLRGKRTFCDQENREAEPKITAGEAKGMIENLPIIRISGSGTFCPIEVKGIDKAGFFDTESKGDYVGWNVDFLVVEYRHIFELLDLFARKGVRKEAVKA
jgi:hypothetical protein